MAPRKLFVNAGHPGIDQKLEMEGASAEIQVANRTDKLREFNEIPDGGLQVLIEVVKAYV